MKVVGTTPNTAAFQIGSRQMAQARDGIFPYGFSSVQVNPRGPGKSSVFFVGHRGGGPYSKRWEDERAQRPDVTRPPIAVPKVGVFIWLHIRKEEVLVSRVV